MSNQVWETWRDDRLATLKQERDQLLAALQDAVELSGEWDGEEPSWIGKARAVIARIEGRKDNHQ